MAQALSRASLLRGRLRNNDQIRPPWSKDESSFVDLCTRCNACIDACEEHIIQRGDGGFPIVNFSNGECTFCEACVTSCQPQALSLSISPAFSTTLSISDQCLPKKNVVCRSCEEQCEVEAISFQLQLGAVAAPEVNTEACNGCGACVASCPTSAISLSNQPLTQ